MWNKLKEKGYPIVLYGTGNAADKIIDELNNRGIEISGIFASDGFVRSREFRGFPVMSYAEAKSKFGSMRVLLCFGSHRKDVIDNFLKISSEQDLYAPDVPVIGEGVFDKEYYDSHKAEFDRVRHMLADDKSRQVLDELIEFRLSGKIEHLIDCETDDDENWGLLELTDNETYMDLGAYTGDTVDMFLSKVNSYNKIVAVEPDNRNFRKLNESLHSLDRCIQINKAISNEDGTMEFSKGNGRGGANGKGKCNIIECSSIDSLANEYCIDVSFIKYDLEGQERLAIEGAKKTIENNKPKMLIAAYHRLEDLWSIPIQVMDIRSDYKVYLRHSPCIPCWEVNYYFI